MNFRQPSPVITSSRHFLSDQLHGKAAQMSRFQARLAGVFYLLTIVVGVFAAFVPSRALSDAGNLIGTAFYVIVTVLLYLILKPVNPALALIAGLVSLAGCHCWCSRSVASLAFLISRHRDLRLLLPAARLPHFSFRVSPALAWPSRRLGRSRMAQLPVAVIRQTSGVRSYDHLASRRGFTDRLSPHEPHQGHSRLRNDRNREMIFQESPMGDSQAACTPAA